MRQEEAALRAFLREKLAENNLEADEKALDVVAAVTKLEEGEPDEEKETRYIPIREGTDGKVTAESIKWYNLMKISFHDLSGFLIKETAILFSQDARIQVFLSLLNLLHEFYPKLTYQFNETDARILLAIHNLGNEKFMIPELLDSYMQYFGKPLPASQAERSLNFFEQMKVLTNSEDGSYSKREEMYYERD